MRYAIINSVTGRVENVVNWDGTSHWLVDEGFYLVQSDTLQMGQYIEGFAATAEEIAAAKAERILQIKSAAQEKIYSIVPAWKQANMTARAVELQGYRFEREWTAEETAEYNSMQAVWSQIKAIRSASDEAEAAVNAATTIEEVRQATF